MTPVGRRIVASVVLVAVLLLVVSWGLLWQPFASSAGEPPVHVTIPKGAGVSRIGDLLERAGVVDNAFLFSLRARLEGAQSDLKAGDVTLRRSMTYGEALSALTSAPASAPVRSVTIPEGLSRGQVARLVGRSGVGGDYWALTRSSPVLDPVTYGAPAGASLEGFLFPSTYELRLPPSAGSLVEAQLRAFKDRFSRIDLAVARQKHLSAFDVITIASMIERETAAPVERGLVGSVIWNRLHKRMPLGIDATTRYQFDNWTRPLLQSELSADSPWNTRSHAGLPPGPIGSPGEASLKAAANPARSAFLYYVVKPWTCGRHAFSATQAQFDADVAAYMNAREKNGGRAPTRCP